MQGANAFLLSWFYSLELSDGNGGSLPVLELFKPVFFPHFFTGKCLDHNYTAHFSFFPSELQVTNLQRQKHINDIYHIRVTLRGITLFFFRFVCYFGISSDNN